MPITRQPIHPTNSPRPQQHNNIQPTHSQLKQSTIQSTKLKQPNTLQTTYKRLHHDKQPSKRLQLNSQPTKSSTPTQHRHNQNSTTLQIHQTTRLKLRPIPPIHRQARLQQPTHIHPIHPHHAQTKRHNSSKHNTRPPQPSQP